MFTKWLANVCVQCYCAKFNNIQVCIMFLESMQSLGPCHTTEHVFSYCCAVCTGVTGA